jgi:hypothetical protein
MADKELYPPGSIFLYSEPRTEGLHLILQWISETDYSGLFVELDRDFDSIPGFIVLRQTDLIIGRLPLEEHPTAIRHERVFATQINEYHSRVAQVTTEMVLKIKMKLIGLLSQA